MVYYRRKVKEIQKMKKLNANEWIYNDNERTLEGQLRYAVACEAYGYINGINDCDYPDLTKSEWIRYIVQGVKMGASDYLNINGLDYRHLNFAGDDRLNEIAEYYVENCDEVKAHTKEERA